MLSRLTNPLADWVSALVSGTVAVIVVRIIKAIAGAKEQARHGKYSSQHDDKQFDVHVLVVQFEQLHEQLH
jgi:hypothetical protein